MNIDPKQFVARFENECMIRILAMFGAIIASYDTCLRGAARGEPDVRDQPRERGRDGREH